MPIKNSLFIFTFIFISLCSCNQSPKETEGSLKEKKNTAPYTHQLTPTRTQVFAIDEETSITNYFYDAFTISGIEYMGMINRNNNSLQIYSIPGGELQTKIKFDEEGPNAFPKLGAFTVVNQDSIFVVNQYSKNLWLVDINGAVQKKYNVMNIDKSLFSLSTTFYTGKKPLFIDDKLYIKSLSKNIDNFNMAFFDPDNQLEIEIDLVKENWKYVNVSFPSLYKGNIWRFDVSRELGRNGNIIYSYAVDPDLHEYDRIKWIPTAHRAESEFVESIKPLQDPGDEEEVSKYFLEAPKYSNLTYDKYHDIYYRFVSHGIEPINSVTGERNTYDDTPFSIIILDSVFNKIGEIKLEGFKYQINCYFITKEGLFVSNSNSKNPNLNEDKLEFTLFELQNLKN